MGTSVEDVLDVFVTTTRRYPGGPARSQALESANAARSGFHSGINITAHRAPARVFSMTGSHGIVLNIRRGITPCF